MFLPLALLPVTFVAAPKEVVLTQGMAISKSCRVAKKTYRFNAPQGERKAGEETIPTYRPALTIRGNGITVDFAGATLQGSPERAWPDARRGLAILVEGNDVTIKNLNVHGFKAGIIARNAKGLKVLDSDLSYNWKQRLRSTVEKEDLSDWMSYHHNEQDEWMRYGAGIYLSGCDGFEVRGTKIEGGQCGLMLNRSNHGKIWNNDFSFLSGVGLGLYRSSENVVMHNRIDWCVRGYSYGVYNRGQDSAGILIFEQCNRNLFAYNSVTHGGDGFFLWAGQQTMDTGEGGCNDNLLYGNDFSHAPTNGIEATFSRNDFVNNKVWECFHGVWGGYSYDTKVLANDFRENQRAIAIEHGAANVIAMNRFLADDVAIALWGGPVHPKFAFAQKRDTRSRNNTILGNLFEGNPLALDLRETLDTRLERNAFYHVDQATRIPSGQNPFSPVPDGNSATADTHGVPGHTFPTSDFGLGRVQPWNALHPQTEEAGYRQPAPLKGGIGAFLPAGQPRGWKYILVDEWGPYDFKRPILWPERRAKSGAPAPGGTSAGSGRKAIPTEKSDPSHIRYEVLGPKGRWRLVSAENATLNATNGTVPGFVDVRMKPGQSGATKVELEYVGTETTDVRGVKTPAGKPVRFGFSRFFAPIEWNVRFFRWSQSENPSEPHANPRDFESVLASAPIKELRTDRLDYAGYALVPGLPNDHYATLAEGTFEAPAGEYTFELTTDDGARVWLDGKPLITDAWKYQGPTTYARTVRLAAGTHKVRVEHFQIDGYATLRFGFRPKG